MFSFTLSLYQFDHWQVLEVFENWQPQQVRPMLEASRSILVRHGTVPWKPFQVEWLDDSSCNVIFEDGENVQKVHRFIAELFSERR